MTFEYGYRTTLHGKDKWPGWSRTDTKETCRARGWVMIVREVSPSRIVSV